MTQTLITVGKVSPSGTVKVSGAKNSATRLLAAALITDEKVILRNFPTMLLDAIHKKRFIEESGGIITFDDKEEIATIDASKLHKTKISHYDFPIRTTYLLAAPLLKRNGIARIPYPGGCKIGSRGYDLHIKVWEACGCKVKQKADYIEVTCKTLKPFKVDFPISTIGGTENALICASCIEGESFIRNAYISPEVQDLINFLTGLGSEITVSGNSYIRILGTNYPGGITHSVIPDRIEAITWIVLAAISNGNLLIKDVPFNSMKIPLIHLNEAGLNFFSNESDVLINEYSFNKNFIEPFELACGTHPGIISDMQPFYTLLALKANGISRIYDYRYPERLNYLKELSKHCPPNVIDWENGKITVKGPVELKAAETKSTDLRGSMALLMAALASDGTSKVRDVQMALRGYNRLESKLKKMGYKVSIIDD
jgi:UDP-N-acetylglucosamine 1-carboxyvinyltransferase